MSSLRLAYLSLVEQPLPSPCILPPENFAVVYSVCMRSDGETVHVVRCTLHYT